jgi:hypothetical protein
METTYKFLSDSEPTDEQLHLIMMEVAADSKKKAIKSNSLFWEQLQQMVETAKKIKPNKIAQAR